MINFTSGMLKINDTYYPTKNINFISEDYYNPEIIRVGVVGLDNSQKVRNTNLKKAVDAYMDADNNNKVIDLNA